LDINLAPQNYRHPYPISQRIPLPHPKLQARRLSIASADLTVFFARQRPFPTVGRRPACLALLQLNWLNLPPSCLVSRPALMR
jgi:hypothetical protein